MTTPSQIHRELVRDLAPIGTALVDCAARLAYIRELLPARGELVEEFSELVKTLTWIDEAYRTADEKLVQAYHELEHAERAEREGWQPQHLHTNGNNAE